MKKLTYLFVFLLPIMAFAQIDEQQLQKELAQLSQNSQDEFNVSQATLHEAQAVVSVLREGRVHRECDGLVINHYGTIAVESSCLSDMNMEEKPLVQIHVTFPFMTTNGQTFFFKTEALALRTKYGGLMILSSVDPLDAQVQDRIKQTFPVIDKKTNKRLSIPHYLALRTLHHKPRVPTKTWGICAVPPCDEPADQA